MRSVAFMGSESDCFILLDLQFFFRTLDTIKGGSYQIDFNDLKRFLDLKNPSQQGSASSLAEKGGTMLHRKTIWLLVVVFLLPILSCTRLEAPAPPQGVPLSTEKLPALTSIPLEPELEKPFGNWFQ